MAASVFLVLSRRLQAPVAAMLILGAFQLVAAVKAPAPTVHVRGVLAAAPQIVAERS